MATDTTALERAAKRLRAADPRAGLDELLEAWRSLPTPGLAALIERLDEHLVRLAPPPKLGGSNMHEAWRQALTESTTDGLSPLFDAVVAGLPRQAAQRLDWLREQLGPRVRDPRLARRGWVWMRDVPLRGSAARSLYEKLGELLQTIDDPRWDAEILAADAGVEGVYTKPRLTAVGVRTGLAAFARLVAHVRARAPRPQPDDAIERALAELTGLVERIIAAGSEQTEATLLADIFAAPGDDGPRAIYADFLQQRGDPRGEFIALQLARAQTGAGPSRRERSLEKQYGRQWVGGLGPFILASGRSFRRGFLAACRYKNDRLDLDPMGIPDWATVEAIDVSPHVFASGSARVILQPHLGELRIIDGLAPEDFSQICTQERPLPFEELSFRRGDLREIAAMLLSCTCLPKLRVLRLANLVGVDEASIERVRATRRGAAFELV